MLILSGGEQATRMDRKLVEWLIPAKHELASKPAALNYDSMRFCKSGLLARAREWIRSD